MVCGANDIACQIGSWLTQNSEVVKDVLTAAAGFFELLLGDKSPVREFVGAWGDKLVAVASLSFAVWRWWVYREAILHKRLEEYLAENDKRLGPSGNAVAQALLRPGRTPRLPYPPFARELRRILIRFGWRERLSIYQKVSFAGQVRWRLEETMDRTRRRVVTAQRAIDSLHAQQAHIHLIAGAIAAARARNSANPAVVNRSDADALREFQSMLKVPGHERNHHAKENEAFQLFRLGNHSLALAAYEELESFAATLPEQRARDLVVARAKRFRAQILQGLAGESWSMAAYQLMKIDASCALSLRQAYQTYDGWDAIEQAEMHYVTAWIASKRGGWHQVEAQQLQLCVQSYEQVLSHLPRRNWLVHRWDRALRVEASIGRHRALQAEKGADYDEEWLGFQRSLTNQPTEYATVAAAVA